MKNGNKICLCFSDSCQRCNSLEFQAQQKEARKRRLTIPDFRRDSGPAFPPAKGW